MGKLTINVVVPIPVIRNIHLCKDIRQMCAGQSKFQVKKFQRKNEIDIIERRKKYMMIYGRGTENVRSSIESP